MVKLLINHCNEPLKYDPKDREIDKDEVIFWLYTTIREEKLPITYYNNMIEAGIVMGEIFNVLF